MRDREQGFSLIVIFLIFIVGLFVVEALLYALHRGRDNSPSVGCDRTCLQTAVEQIAVPADFKLSNKQWNNSSHAWYYTYTIASSKYSDAFSQLKQAEANAGYTVQQASNGPAEGTDAKHHIRLTSSTNGDQNGTTTVLVTASAY